MQGLTFSSEGENRRCVIENPADGNYVASLVVGIYLNCNGFSHKGFFEAMLKETPKTQHNFTALCLEWFHAVANVNYYDDRNEDSVMLGRSIASLSLELVHKPMAKPKNNEGMELDYINSGDIERLMVFYLSASWNDFEAFTKMALYEHKTLQQSFSRLCIAWFRTLTEEMPGSKAKYVTVARKALTCFTQLRYI